MEEVQMKAAENTLVVVQDSLYNLRKQIDSLKDLSNVLQSGFEEINDDNNKFVVSCLVVIETQLSYISADVIKEIHRINSAFDEKEEDRIPVEE